jgi:Fe-S oxidoreductase
MRAISEEVVDLVRKHGGWNSSEHGDGLVRSEFNRRIFGEELYGAMQEVKRIFDPEWRMNPGKKVNAPSMTDSLREPNLPIPVDLKTHFHFDFEDGMRGSANSCQRIGICRKGPGTGGVMCPSYMATLQEEHSTRGRANALLKALSSPDPHAALGEERLHEVLDLCLECKACQTECPLSVDMATMKSEALAHRYEQHGTPLSALFFGNARLLNQLGSAFAPLSNLPGRIGLLRILMERVLKVDRRRPLPEFASESLPKWFRKRQRARASANASSSRSLLFLADSFSSYTEPEIGKAAIELLEAAGWEVQLVDNVCCGRSLLSKGLLGKAKAKHAELLKKLGPAARAGIPIVGVEPSCVLTLRDELLSLNGPSDDGEAIARQAVLADDLLAEALENGGLTPHPARTADPILFHGHCHQKAEGAMEGSVRLLREIAKSSKVDVLDAGCCGMAGSFGFETEHYDLSMKIGRMRLFPAVENAGEGTRVAATGVSCRQQIAQGTGRTAKHPIVLLRETLDL